MPENPAVILLDLKMPRMDGVEVLEAVRADEQISQIPIVMLTSSNQETDLAKSYELGVNAFVVKPMDFQELVKAVSEIGASWAMLNVPPGGSLKLPSDSH